MASLTGGFNSASSVARGGSLNSSTWNSPTNALTDNATRSTHTHGAPNPQNGYTAWLQLSDWSQRGSLPAGCTIDGVSVTINVQNTVDAQVTTSAVRLLLSGSVGTGSPATNPTGTVWTIGSDVNITFGGATEKWSETLTQAICSASNFGVNVSAAQTGEDVDIDAVPAVDYVEMTVYYTAASSTGAPERTRMGVGI